MTRKQRLAHARLWPLLAAIMAMVIVAGVASRAQTQTAEHGAASSGAL